MCNRYSVTKGQQAIRDLFRVSRDATGNATARHFFPTIWLLSFAAARMAASSP